jgi:copper homeostasis protein
LNVIMIFKLEAIGFTIESCRRARAAGVHRVELCDNPADGGTTPSHGFIKAAREALDIELYPIIRPRGGDFLYSEEEFDIMKTDIRICKELKCDGVVLGILRTDGTVDLERCRALVDLAAPLGVTFHRAFDRVADPSRALEQVIDAGCKRMLTSGGYPTALEGIERISTLVKQAGGRISIMPGSGIRSDNILEIAEKTGAREFHASARRNVDTRMEFQNPGMKEILSSVEIDAVEIKKMIDLLEGFSPPGIHM